NAPPALLSVRYVAEPSSLTCLSPSAPGKRATASGLLGAPEEGYLFGGSVCARGFKEGQRRVSPHSASQLRRPHAPPVRCSPLRRPPPSPRGTLPGAQRGGGGGQGGGRRRRPGGRRWTREAAPGASTSRAAGREGEAEPRETGTPRVGAGAKPRGSGGERAGRGPRPGASRGTGRRRRRR
ncbi:serine/arginine repetitive matrix protein 3-like, partial [Mustela erminea]|uniref:serine/arginine repetitive matrix protein 3-like n=1 Tax=Mustela erminea TaxID=36723 RepID=UPI0013873E72